MLNEDRLASARFNAGCDCVPRNAAQARALVAAACGAPELIEARPNLVAETGVFLARSDLEIMRETIDAVEAAARLPGYRLATLSSAISTLDFGPSGVFMGYDFHITPEGPRLIEINTNAGGALIANLAGRAYAPCCDEVSGAIEGEHGQEDFGDRVFSMFLAEWRAQRGTAPLRHVAIVDDDPRSQYLYPEFLLAKQLFEQRGVKASIVDAASLSFADGTLIANGEAADLVYNRLVDFDLSRPEHGALRHAYAAGAAVVTPAPRHHALYAHKANLARLRDEAALKDWGLAPARRERLSAVLPDAVIVSPDNADDLWADRRRWFFKPFAGHAAKAVYRGDKLTRSVWRSIAGGGYLAQKLAAPEMRALPGADGQMLSYKADIRVYAYAGTPLSLAARLYRGQTTNFRTAGGGFAPVYLTGEGAQTAPGTP